MNPAPKQYELSFEKRPDYLFVRISVPLVTRALAFDYLSEIVNKCGEMRCRRLMIERDVPAEPSIHTLGAFHEFLLMNHGLRIAVVNKHGEAGEPLRHLIQSHAARGNIAHFAAEATAEEWLLVD